MNRLEKIAEKLENHIEKQAATIKEKDEQIEKLSAEVKELRKFKENRSRKEKARGIARTFEKKGYISEEQIEKTAQELLDEDTNLDELAKVAEAFDPNAKQVGELTKDASSRLSRDEAFIIQLNK